MAIFPMNMTGRETVVSADKFSANSHILPYCCFSITFAALYYHCLIICLILYRILHVQTYISVTFFYQNVKQLRFRCEVICVLIWQLLNIENILTICDWCWSSFRNCHKSTSHKWYQLIILTEIKLGGRGRGLSRSIHLSCSDILLRKV